MADIPAPFVSVERQIWRGDVAGSGARAIAEETPVALTYGRATQAVMLATPADLEDFAVGFSLSEGIVGAASEIEALEVVASEDGVELRMDLAADRQSELGRRQRRIIGLGGCGLCGLDSLAEAGRPPPRVVSTARFSAAEIRLALDALSATQALNARTRAVHGAAFWTRDRGIVASREDVGRHNALDKLIGALARSGHSAADGILLLSSRISVELVQKAAVLGAPIIVAVSAPTALAVRVADAAGMTLVGIARQDGFEVFTHHDRIELEMVRHVA